MKYSKFFTAIFIFLLAFGIRSYQLPNRFSFTADEEYQSTYASTIVEDFHPVWIGVSAGDTGFYLGPYFTYFTSFWLKLSAGDPLITGYIAAIIGSITAVLILYLGKLISSPKVGFIAASFYSLSPLVVYFDQRYWNPTPVPFLVCLLLISLIKLKDSSWWLVVTSFCLGAIWHVHLSLVPLYLLAAWAIWQHKSKLSLKSWIASITVFGFMLLPLGIFDYNHDFSNILTPIRLLQSGGRSVDLGTHMSKFGETLSRFVYLSPGLTNDGELRSSCTTGSTKPSALVMFLFTLPLLIFLLQKKNWQDPGLKILSLAIVLLSLSFIFYPGPIAPYYALGLVPLYFLVLAITLKRFSWPVLIIFALLSIRTLAMTDDSYGLEAKKAVISQVMSVVKSDTFTLIEAGECHKYAGWRYLFKVYGRTPATSSTDSSLGWLYPKEIGESGTYEVMVGDAHEFEAPPDPLAIIESGGYTAFITKTMLP